MQTVRELKPDYRSADSFSPSCCTCETRTWDVRLGAEAKLSCDNSKSLEASDASALMSLRCINVKTLESFQFYLWWVFVVVAISTEALAANANCAFPPQLAAAVVKHGKSNEFVISAVFVWEEKIVLHSKAWIFWELFFCRCICFNDVREEWEETDAVELVHLQYTQHRCPSHMDIPYFT